MWQYTALTYSFFYLEPVCCSMSSSNCCFLTCIQISQEASQMVWSSHIFKNFPQFVVIHTAKGFGIVNKTEVDVFLELLLFQWSSGCWQFDLWFLCLFWIQFERLEVLGSWTVEAWLGEFYKPCKLVLPLPTLDASRNFYLSPMFWTLKLMWVSVRHFPAFVLSTW